MNFKELIDYGKTHGISAMQKRIEEMMPEQKRALVSPVCNAVDDLAKMFVPAAIDHIVETNHPLGQTSKNETQELMQRLTQ